MNNYKTFDLNVGFAIFVKLEGHHLSGEPYTTILPVGSDRCVSCGRQVDLFANSSSPGMFWSRINGDSRYGYEPYHDACWSADEFAAANAKPVDDQAPSADWHDAPWGTETAREALRWAHDHQR